MIWIFILQAIATLLDAVFFWLPKVTELPFGADAVLIQIVGWVNTLCYELPPAVIVRETALWVLGFELSILILVQLRIIKL